MAIVGLDHFKNDGDAAIYSILSRVLSEEAQALEQTAHHMPESAVTLVNHVVYAAGRVVATGLGKSGIVAHKFSSTLASLGKPAFFLHPIEALHGDIGMITAGDLLIIFSKTGTGDDFFRLIAAARSRGITSCVLICCKKGPITEACDLVIQLPIIAEACALQLAPTTSSTVMLAFSDALAVAVSSCLKFNRDDYARCHPAGSLGNNLILLVADLMHTGDDLPILLPSASFAELLVKITGKKLGIGIVVDADKKLLGVITDGDLRRACERGPAVFNATAVEIMTSNPKALHATDRAYTALCLMEDYRITSLVVVDREIVTGLVHLHDLVRAGIQRQ